MTVSNLSIKTLQAIDGTTPIFSFDFHIQGTLEPEWIQQIEVYENGLLTIIPYTITGVSPAGGTITLDSIPSVLPNGSNGELSIVRKVPQTQDESYPVSQAFPAKAVEYSLDRQTLKNQEANSDNVIRQPVYEQNKNMVVPDIANRASKAMVFDQQSNVDVSDLLVMPAMVETGIATFIGSAAIQVTLLTPRTDDYVILTGKDSNENIWWSFKDQNGFILESDNASSTASVSWMVL